MVVNKSSIQGGRELKLVHLTPRDCFGVTPLLSFISELGSGFALVVVAFWT